MTRLINAILITVFAFFVFLGVFWQFAGGGTGAGPRGEPSVEAIEPRWQPGAGPELLVDLRVHNPAGLDGELASVSYEALLDGRVLDRAVARVPFSGPVAIGPESEANVAFAVDLPERFANDWWASYMRSGEKAELRIHGAVELRREDGVHEAPFEWRSTWTGELAERLEAAVRNCDATPTDLCMAGSSFEWRDGSLRATLTLRNPGTEAVAVRNASLRLLFAERPVVSGGVDLVQRLDPGAEAEVELALAFAPDAIAAWWPDHVARCERTPVALGMDLQAHSIPRGSETESEVTTLQWTFPASTFQTRFACA